MCVCVCVCVCVSAAQIPTNVGTDLPDPCGSPPEPSIFACRLLYTVGISVTYKCIDGYVRLLGDERLNCSNGRWQGELLQCRRKLERDVEL